jgi:cold shock CspA family protein/ribosome-associated translation inhibitor RaiA
MDMQVAPSIKFHGIERSRWVENYMAGRLRRLERYAEGVTSCHVTLSREQASQNKGNRYSVMVEVRIPPNHDLAVKKQKIVHAMHTQLPALINLAFGAIEKQLKKTAQLRRADVKTHNGEPRGLVEKLNPEGYGFIRSFYNQEVYFHRNSVLHGDFERLSVGTEVRFEPEEGDEGLQASSVQIVAKPGVRSERPPGR